MIFYLFDRTFALASVLLSQVDSLTLWGTFMVMGYLVWRLYRFHLWPLLHSSDPKEPPYWIPCECPMILFVPRTMLIEIKYGVSLLCILGVWIFTDGN